MYLDWLANRVIAYRESNGEHEEVLAPSSSLPPTKCGTHYVGGVLMSAVSETIPTRKLRLLGDGFHGENTVTTRNAEHEVEQASMVVTDSYRQAYGIAMYERPDVLEVIDRTSLDADYPACPCATTTL